MSVGSLKGSANDRKGEMVVETAQNDEKWIYLFLFYVSVVTAKHIYCIFSLHLKKHKLLVHT